MTFRVNSGRRVQQGPEIDPAERCLLSVVDGDARELLARCVRHVSRERPRLVVGGELHGTGDGCLAILPVGKYIVAGAGQLERSGVRGWIACDRVVFAVELAGPLVVCGLAGAV